ncbi:putative coat protein [Zostera marina amalgavirus 2]|uniref:Putative coat protein n=1 Tax=Zostera marina amalgavirus 2 TaxID=2560851 RepID=A0A1W6R5E7_9VIRU|nr:putative coat protein [Zostera marina amalgavirus 2]ARO49648.1 putative coat protein [Zostera marina amalgavirus 2]
MFFRCEKMANEDGSSVPLKTQAQVDEERDVAQLNKALSYLDLGGMPIAPWALQDVADCSYTVARALRKLKILKPHYDNKHLQKLFHYCEENAVIDSTLPLKLSSVFRFCDWLLSPVAKRKIEQLVNADRLKKRSRDAITPAETALVAILEVAQNDCVADVSRVRITYDEEIKKLKRKIGKLEEHKARKIEKARKKYPGLLLLERPSESDVCNQAWHKYVEYCNASGIKQEKRSNASLEKAISMFDNILRLEIKAKCCEKPEVRDYLLQYCKEKIKGFRDDADKKRVDTFKGYYSAATGEPLPEGSSRKKRRTAASDSSGDSESDGASERDDVVAGDFVDRIFKEQTSGGEQSETPPPQETRDADIADESSHGKSKGKSASRLRSRIRTRAQNRKK